MAVFQRAGFALPTVLAVALEIGNSVDAGAVVATRVGRTVIRI